MSRWRACGTCSPAMPGLVSVGQQAYRRARRLCAVRARPSSPACIRSSAIPIAGLVAAVVAVPVAALIFRLRGHYFAIGTWVVAEVFRLLASQVSALGGGSGMSLPAGIVIAMAPNAADARVPDLLGRACARGRDRRADRAAAALALRPRAHRHPRQRACRARATASTSGASSSSSTSSPRSAPRWSARSIFLQKLRISPDTAFSVNDWTAFVIFITVIGGIGRIEGPIIGTIVFFMLRQTLADLGSALSADARRGGDRGDAVGAARASGACRGPLRLAGFSAGAAARVPGRHKGLTLPVCKRRRRWSMIPKSGRRFSEKITLRQ